MVYLSVIIIILAVYIGFLELKLRKINHSLKELIKENEKHETLSSQEPSDIYFKIDKDFRLTFLSESGYKILGIQPEDVIGKSILGTIWEDSEANKENLQNILSKISKNQGTINARQVIIKNNQKQVMWCRQRPILNEILECEGISFLCKDISEAHEWKEKLNRLENKDLFTDGLKEEALIERMDHDFKLAKRYNKEFSFVAIELKDIYEFISKGIDFETADKLLKNITDMGQKMLPGNRLIGRFDKTKIGFILRDSSREQAKELAEKLQKEAIPVIRKLGVDGYNAEMIILSYTNRRNFIDSADGMLARVRRHISNASRRREYGIISSDKTSTPLADKS